MKTVSIQELKADLSRLLAEVAAGARVLITKHRRSIAVLSPPEVHPVRVGRRFGRAKLEPCLENATAGRYLDVLAEDRRDEG